MSAILQKGLWHVELLWNMCDLVPMELGIYKAWSGSSFYLFLTSCCKRHMKVTGRWLKFLADFCILLVNIMRVHGPIVVSFECKAAITHQDSSIYGLIMQGLHGYLHMWMNHLHLHRLETDMFLFSVEELIEQVFCTTIQSVNAERWWQGWSWITHSMQTKAAVTITCNYTSLSVVL